MDARLLRSPILRALVVSVWLACARSKAPPGADISSAPADGPAAFAAPTRLKATLVAGPSVALSWKHNASAAGGAWIEFTTPGADFVKLGVAWPDSTGFLHPDLAAATTYIYRLVPFFGRPSAIVEIVTGREQTERATEGPIDDSPPGNAPARSSLRALATVAAAAPTNLRVERPSPTAAELRWEDRASDEDGYLVELATHGTDFTVCALLPPDATSFRKIALLPETRVAFRVRAFFLAAPTRPVSATTPGTD